MCDESLRTASSSFRARRVATLLAFAVASTVSAQGRRPDFVVAEVRADGLLLPVAKWDGARWHSLAMVKSDSVPYWGPEGRWYYVAFSGARSRLAAIDVVSILGESYDSWGFTTNLHVRSFDPDSGTPRVGIATSDSVPVRLFRTASARESALAQSALRRLLDSVRTVKRRGLGPRTVPDSFTVFSRPTAIRLSAGVALLNASAWIPIDTVAGFAYCPTLAAYDGWIVARGDRAEVFNSPVLTDCDHKEVTAVDPVAVFELRGRMFVLARHVGWEERAAAIYEWRNSQLTLVFESTH